MRLKRLRLALALFMALMMLMSIALVAQGGGGGGGGSGPGDIAVPTVPPIPVETCVGPTACLELIDSGVCDPDHFECLGNGEPFCICLTKDVVS